MSRAKRAAERAGRRAEIWVEWWLRLKLYRPVARRVRGPGGEIDLLMRRGAWLVAVEVKYRPDPTRAVEAFTPRQRLRVARTLEAEAARRGHHGPLRCDLVACAPWSLPRHLIDVRP